MGWRDACAQLELSSAGIHPPSAVPKSSGWPWVSVMASWGGWHVPALWGVSGAAPRTGALRWANEMHFVPHEALVSWGQGLLWDANWFSGKAHPCAKASHFICIQLIRCSHVSKATLTSRRRCHSQATQPTSMLLLPGTGVSLLAAPAGQCMWIGNLMYKQGGHQTHSHAYLQTVMSPSKHTFVNTICSL